MAERQLHGLQWESHIKKQLNLSSNSYTSHWDGELDGLPLSIKCMGISNALEMSSLLRFWQSPPFLMIVGWWKDSKEEEVHHFGILNEGEIEPNAQELEDEDEGIFFWLTQDEALAIGSDEYLDLYMKATKAAISINACSNDVSDKSAGVASSLL